MPGLVDFYNIQPENVASLFIQPWEPARGYTLGPTICKQNSPRVTADIEGIDSWFRSDLSGSKSRPAPVPADSSSVVEWTARIRTRRALSGLFFDIFLLFFFCSMPLSLSFSLSIAATFPYGSRLAGIRMSPLDFVGAKGDGGSGGGGNNWSYKPWKSPVKLLPPTNPLLFTVNI